MFPMSTAILFLIGTFFLKFLSPFCKVFLYKRFDLCYYKVTSRNTITEKGEDMGEHKEIETLSTIKDYMKENLEQNAKLTLGQKLYALRKRDGRTLEEVAKAIGVSRPLINNYERDARNPSYKVLKSLADYYGVSTDYLLGYDDTEPEEDPDDNTRVLLQTLKGASKREIDQAIKIIEALKGTMPD